MLMHQNKVKKLKSDEILAPYIKEGDKESEKDGGLEAWMELGDRHPDFVYTI